MFSSYSLHKSRKILRHAFSQFCKKTNRLEPIQREEIEATLRKLDRAILDKKKQEAHLLAKRVQLYLKKELKKTFFDYIKEFSVAIVFAIAVAYLIRQFWFELYEVPTGSMRPTIQEQDRLVVSKTTFGFHDALLFNKPLLFDKSQLVRDGMIVFTVKGMEMKDAKALYFGFIPGLKQLVKRSPTLPGDTIYFYGGKIYGVGKDGSTYISPQEGSNLEHLERVPFSTFEGDPLYQGRISDGYYSKTVIKHFNLPVARLESESNGRIQGEFYDGNQWQKETPAEMKSTHDHPVAFMDLWGLKNYGMSRLLTAKEAAQFYQIPLDQKEEQLILEIRHTPSLNYPSAEIRRTESGVFAPQLTPRVSLIPLRIHHLKRLLEGMTTARFYVKDETAYRYTESGGRPQNVRFDTPLPGVPNGCYEFYKGKAYKVYLGGFRRLLPHTHALYALEPSQVRHLFNQGTYFNQVFEPLAANQPYNPHRYAYWNKGTLYVMGTPLLLEGEPETTAFIESELQKQEASGSMAPYIAFIDSGAPIKKGDIDAHFIKKFGLKIPEDGIIGLGDNYAGSSDSRSFGFVPLENLRGSPVVTFWPFSSRFGFLPQPGYPFWTLPTMISWSLALSVFLIVVLYQRKRANTSLFKD